MTKRRGLFILAFLITVLLVYILVKEAGFSNILSTLGTLPLSTLLLTLVLYVGIYLLRLLRFQVLLSKKIPFPSFFSIICVHNLANVVLPARTGELSYLYLLKKKYGVKGSESLATLTIARLGDLLSILLFFSLGVFFVQNLPATVHIVLQYFTAFMLSCLAVLTFLILFKYKVKVLFEHCLTWLCMEKIPFIVKLQHAIGDTLDFIKEKRTAHRLLLALLFSLLQWLLMYAFTYTLVRALGMPASFPQVLVGSSLALVATILPVQGIMGFGTTEGIWTIVFLALGFEKTATIAAGFGVHVVSLLFSLLLGLWGIHALRSHSKKLFPPGP